MAPLARLKERVQRIIAGTPHAQRILRRRNIQAALHRRLSFVQLALLAAGYIWMLALPSTRLGRRTYHDENALQPAQVTTSWSWEDVHRADGYLNDLEVLHSRNASSEERARYISTEFKRLGMSGFEQRYAYAATSATLNGTNAYAISSSPRASGTEAIVVSASWISRTGEGNGTPNLRGISMVLSMAAFLKDYSLWAKDLVFVISDGHMDGMHAFLSAYHHSEQSNLKAEPLSISPGVIWTAFNLDYACHSFSHLGVFFEGLNGRLPNQDLFNAFHTISRHTGGVPVVLYDHLDPREPGGELGPSFIPSWLPKAVQDHADVIEYASRMRNILRHVGYQAQGRASGVHGLFHQFRIDAFTIFAVPASGPHGFHALGRVMESTLRTANNLLERLHASFFFYILTTPGTFLTVGSYLPCVLLISIAMMIGGLGEYVRAGWTVDTAASQASSAKQARDFTIEVKWIRRRRPVLAALAIMAASHAAGALLFYTVSKYPSLASSTLLWSITAFASILAGTLMAFTSARPGRAPLWRVLKAFNLCLASTIISVTSLLNFSLAGVLAILLGIPLSITRFSSTRFEVIIPLASVIFWYTDESRLVEALWNWNILGVWFAPFLYIVYLPLCFQAAAVVCMPE